MLATRTRIGVVTVGVLVGAFLAVVAPGNNGPAVTSPPPWRLYRGFNMRPVPGTDQRTVNAQMDAIWDDTGSTASTRANLIRLSFASAGDWLMDKFSGSACTSHPAGAAEGTDPAGPYPICAANLAKLRMALTWADGNDVKVVIDPHTAPGFSDNFTTRASDLFWQDPAWLANLVRLWQTIVQDVGDWGLGVVAGYDLMNEPYTPDPAGDCPVRWGPPATGPDPGTSVISALTRTIRGMGDRHVLVIEPASHNIGGACDGTGTLSRTDQQTAIESLVLPRTPDT